MLKKRALLIFLLILSLLFCSVGCDNTDPDDPAPTPEEETAETPDKKEEEGDEETDINELRSRYQYGTCQNLRGNVSVVLFFMEDFESGWDSSEIEPFMQDEIEPGLSFLEEEARKYNVDLNLTVADTYFSVYYDGELANGSQGTSVASVDVLKQVASQLNYTSDSEMISAFKTLYGTEEVVCLTLFNKNGSSYAINPKRGGELDAEEHCILFSNDLNAQWYFTGSFVSVVAHEMLHLFGAEDLYVTTRRKNIATRYYPSDVMLSCAYDISENSIEAATAFYIGWTDEIPEVFQYRYW